MSLPIILISELPLWYHWIGNIVALMIIIGSIAYAVIINEYDDEWQALRYTSLIMIMGIFIAILSIAAWGILVFIIPGVIIYGIRRGYWGIKDWYFYRKHDQ